MPFLLSQPAVTWLFPAIALPIIFHLFFRLRRTVRDFPSLMFFLRIDPRLSAKRKIHEWLVLLLRCLVIALLLLALARPLINARGAGGPVARLVLIDNSGSMAAPSPSGPSISKLTLASRAADKLIASSLPDDAIAAQLMVPDPTATLPHGFDTPPAALRDAIDKLTPSDGSASVPRAVRLALATLANAKPAQRELHIVTDLERKNWSRGDLGPEAADVRIIIHRLDSTPVAAGSVSLEMQDVPARAIPAGRVTPVHVILQNHGPVAAKVKLNSTDDSGKNISHDIEVPANGTTPATLTFSFPNPGFHWAQVWVEGDVAPAGTSADLGFWCTDVRKVDFIGGKDDFATLPNAVSPGGNPDLSGIDAIITSSDELASSIAANPLALVLTWENFPQDAASSQALQDYVRQGGTLIIVPTSDSGVAISRPVPAWLDASMGSLQTPKEAESILLLQDGDAIWRDLRDAEGRPKIGLLRVFQYHPLGLGNGNNWQLLASSANGSGLLARRNLDKGRIFLSGIAFAPKWSSLPLKAGFVVLVQNAIFGEQSEQIPVQPIFAGDEFRFDFPGEAANIKSLAGSALVWQGQVRDFDGLPRAGVYEISQRDHVNWVVTSGNPDEADTEFLPLAPVPLLRNLPHEVAPLVREDDITHAQLSPSSGTSLFRWLLLAALFLLLLETWLANERSSDLGKNLFDSLLPTSKSPSKEKTKAPKKDAPKKRREVTPV